MHPLFTSLRRLGTYLIGWLIVAVLMAAVSTRLGLSWLEALTLLVPVFLVYSFVCLSAWYVCRAAPLRTGSGLRVIASCGLRGIVSGASRAVLGWGGSGGRVPGPFGPARLLAWTTPWGRRAPFADAGSRYEQQI